MSSYIRILLEEKEMTRNQVAQISGLSNSHLIALEKEDIKRIRRDTLLYLLIALNLEIGSINEALDHFNMPRLVAGDASTFVEATRRRTITGIQPLYAGISFSILHIAMERLDGDLVIIDDKPSSVLRLPEYYTREEEVILKQYNVYKDIKAALHNERRIIFDEFLKKYTVHSIICEDCLRQYMSMYKEFDYTKKYYLKSHFQELIRYIPNPNYKFELLKPGKCTYLRFDMKFLTQEDKEKQKNKVFFIGQKRHKEVMPVLNGFATDSTKMFNYFNLEYLRLKTDESINTEYSNKDSMIRHLKNLFREETGVDLYD